MAKENSKVICITPEEALEVIKENKGKFFSCEFTKKDGTHRKMHGRTGVTKYLSASRVRAYKQSGVTKSVTLWERKLEDYRKVNTETLSKLTLRHRKYAVK